MFRRPQSLLALALLVLAAATPFASAQDRAAPPGSDQQHSGLWPEFASQAPLGSQRGGFENYGKRWVPGHWTVQMKRVWQPGRSVRVWVEAVYALRLDACGNSVRVLVTPGHWTTRSEPGCWVSQRVKVWVPGRWT